MALKRRNVGLAFVQALLWLLAVAGVLGPLFSPLGNPGDDLYWVRVAVRLLLGVLAGVAAVLVRRRHRLAFAIIAVLVVVVLVRGVVIENQVSIIPLVFWPLFLLIVWVNRREFGISTPPSNGQL
jgi:hypothetical protein